MTETNTTQDNYDNSAQKLGTYERFLRPTDVGHADQFIKSYGKNFRYCPELGG